MKNAKIIMFDDTLCYGGGWSGVDTTVFWVGV